MAKAEVWQCNPSWGQGACAHQSSLSGELGTQDCLVRADTTVTWPPDLSR